MESQFPTVSGEEEEVSESEPPVERSEAIQTASVSLARVTRTPSFLKTPVALAFVLAFLTIGVIAAWIGLNIRTRSVSEAQASNPAINPINSIAVLPFKNLSGDPAQEYFSDGLTEELIHLVTRIPGLRVVAWDSASQLRGREHEAQAFPRDRLAVAAMERGDLPAGKDCDCDGHAIGISAASDQAKEPGPRDPARA